MLRIRSYNEGLLLQQKQRQWMDQMALLFPTYLHMKKLTNNWTLDTWDSDYSSKAKKERWSAFARTCLTQYSFWAVDTLSMMLLGKHSKKQMIETVTSPHPQDRLAQRTCPACFGRPLPGSLPNQDSGKIHLCLDGNFQHRHHARAEKGHLALQTPVLFIPPEELQRTNEQICESEINLRKSDQAKDKCAEVHKVADDKRNSSTWKGCNTTGLMGSCCRHDSVLYFCNINRSGEGRGLPLSIIKQLFHELDSLNEGWGLTGGEGLERLWSYLSPLVSPLWYATRNHWLSAINHQSFFHNVQGIERIVSTLKRKYMKALGHCEEAHKVLDDIVVLTNPHVSPLSIYMYQFFRDQWKSQRNYESNQTQADVDKKKQLAVFFREGEKTQASSGVVWINCWFLTRKSQHNNGFPGKDPRTTEGSTGWTR